MPLTLHQQCTNLVSTANPWYKLNTDLALKIQELNTNDLSFTLDGVLSTLQQGSAENGVGSSVELRYHVKKRRAQICGQIQRFIKIPTELRRQTRTSTTHTKQAQRV